MYYCPNIATLLVMWCMLFIALWYMNRERPKRKRKQKRTPEGIWLETCLTECLTYGKPSLVFIRQNLWEHVAYKRMVYDYISGINPIISEHGLHDVSIVVNGIRMDFDYPHGKRKNS